MDNINNLICFLIALQSFCKDIHYNAKGDAFYSKHLLVDRVQENISDYIDRIKEVCILGNNEQTLPSWEYLSAATGLIPEPAESDLDNFRNLAALITSVLSLIEQMEGSQGELNLYASIAEDLQNSLGLVNRQIIE